MQIFENYTNEIQLQFDQGMHKSAIQKIRSVYEFLAVLLLSSSKFALCASIMKLKPLLPLLIRSFS